MQLEVAAVVESDETKNIKLENASNLKTKKRNIIITMGQYDLRHTGRGKIKYPNAKIAISV